MSIALYLYLTRLSLHTNQVTHQARAYPSFSNMKRLGVFQLLPGWDASPMQGYTPPPPSPPCIKFASTHLYTWARLFKSSDSRVQWLHVNGGSLTKLMSFSLPVSNFQNLHT